MVAEAPSKAQMQALRAFRLWSTAIESGVSQLGDPVYVFIGYQLSGTKYSEKTGYVQWYKEGPTERYTRCFLVPLFFMQGTEYWKPLL